MIQGILGTRIRPNIDIADFYVPLFNDGTLNKSDLCVNYVKLQAAVVMLVKKSNDIIVPLFDNIDICKDFSKRNMPGKIYGSTSLSKKFINLFDNKYVFELLDFPKKINISSGFEILSEILDHDDKITLLYN